VTYVPRLLRNWPFLTLVLLAVAVLFIWSAFGLRGYDRFPGAAAFLVLRVVLAPFSTLATWVDPLLGRAPEWLDIVLTGLIGFLPYALADVLLRLVVGRRSAAAGAPDRTAHGE
jgi:hypothetical protein